jgi:acetyl-CoA synthetase
MRVYKPSEEFKQRANLQEDAYLSLQSLADKDPNKYWSSLAKEHLDWFRDFDQVLDDSQAPFYKWFVNGKINLSYNCIDRHLPKHANKTAIIFEGEPGDTKSLTYQELHEQVSKAANMLKELGIKKGDVVCIYMPLCPEAIIAMQACARIGAIHSVVFAGFSAQALRERVVDGKAKLVITSDGLFRRGNIVPLLASVVEAIGLPLLADTEQAELNSSSIRIASKNNLDSPKILCYERVKILSSHTKLINQGTLQNTINEFLQTVTEIKTQITDRLFDWQELMSRQNAHCEPEALDANDISFILYTSGSTGKPKGIQHRTGGYLLWTHVTSKWIFDLKESDIYWCTADIGWITGHSYVVYGPLSNAATIFIYEGAPGYPAENRFWELIEKYHIAIFYTAPTAIRAFMHWGLEKYIKKTEPIHLALGNEALSQMGRFWKHDLSSLRLLGSVGEPINPEVWRWFYEHVGGARCPVVDTWWQTETGGIMISTLPGIHDMQPGSAGLPLPGIKADIDQEGRLYIQSPWPSMLMTIYGNDERYLAGYWSQIPGAYLAGDGAHQDSEGYVTIIGRIDDVLNVAGHRLGTAEIESALVMHPLVTEAAAIGVPHAIKGEAIVAYVVLSKSDVSPDENIVEAMRYTHGRPALGLDQGICEQTNIEELLKNQVTKEIGAIARPERIIICSGLPKTRSGKIMRRVLKDIAQGKKPQGDLSTIENQAILDELNLL